ncbi:hypothetical protein WICPIJ_003564 [Wickerhamomyces pijperi]|uniref:ER membrane protein complex subunit 10 n=1 Tax=Wickerhamomyces pijperi TaxID=599730 RepID=A0A9P8Q9N3_WICPI|nr:hypothetical protein WICPIJ_003564 [Wickerhamomyces pijperi]
MLFQILTSIIFLTQLAQCVPSVQVFARSNHRNKPTIELGTIKFNETSGLADIVNTPNDIDFESGKYCVGVSIAGHFQCHSYVQLSLPLSYDIVLHTKPNTGELVSLSMVKSSTLGLHAVIKPGLILEEPRLKGSNNNVKVKVREVTNDKGETEIVHDGEVIEDQRSFIQKYWTYIVPALIMILMRSGESESEEEKKQRAGSEENKSTSVEGQTTGASEKSETATVASDK